MFLNQDGSATVDGVTLSAAQVEAIKAAKLPDPKQTGWWVVDITRLAPSPRNGAPIKFLGRNPYLNGEAGAGAGATAVTGWHHVIFWGTF